MLVGLGVSSHVTGTNADRDVRQRDGDAGQPAAATAEHAADGDADQPRRAARRSRRRRPSASRASASDSDGTIAKVDFYAGTTLLGTATAAPYTLTWSGVGTGTYTLTAVATDNAGATTTSSAVSVTVSDAPPPPPTGLPAGWAHADIGTVPFAGDATFASGTFSVTGSGADVWGTADQFHYAYTTLTGDGTIVARVASIPLNVNAWVKAGVMIRESLAAGAAHGFMLVSASKGVAFQRRPAAGGASVSTRGLDVDRAALGQAAAQRRPLQRL